MSATKSSSSDISTSDSRSSISSEGDDLPVAPSTADDKEIPPASHNPAASEKKEPKKVHPVPMIVSGAGLKIKGVAGREKAGPASAGAKETRVVRVDNLLPGTTAEDVERAFKRVGPVLWSKASTTVTLTYKYAQDARDAVQVFNEQKADGQTLAVSLVGTGGGS